MLKSAFFTSLCPKGSRRVVKLFWKSWLSGNYSLATNVMFNSHPDFIFSGPFLFPCSLGRPKNCVRERLRTHLFEWKLLKEYLVGVQKSTFFLVVGPQFLVKNDQILKSTFFTCL